MAVLTTLNAASPLDASDNTYLSFSTDANETLSRAVDNVDADLGNMDSLTWSVEHALVGGFNDDVYTLSIRIMSGATVLAALNSGGTVQEVSASVTSATDITAGPTAFTYVNVSTF